MNKLNTLIIFALIFSSISCFYNKMYYRVHSVLEVTHKVNQGNVVVLHLCDKFNNPVLNGVSSNLRVADKKEHKLYPKNHCGFFIEAVELGSASVKLQIDFKIYEIKIEVVDEKTQQQPALEESAFLDFSIETVNDRINNNNINSIEASVSAELNSLITVRHQIYFGYGDDGVNSINKSQTDLQLVAEVDVYEYDYSQYIGRDYYFYYGSYLDTSSNQKIVFDESETFGFTINVKADSS